MNQPTQHRTLSVRVNGHQHTLEAPVTLAQLIRQLKYDTRTGAVALNRTFVPADTYDRVWVHDGDDVEILSPMSGG